MAAKVTLAIMFCSGFGGWIAITESVEYIVKLIGG